jgi:hypothetical protein
LKQVLRSPIEPTVILIAQGTNDANLQDRLLEVNSTYKRHEHGKEITGLPTLANLLGYPNGTSQGIEDRLRQWLGYTSVSKTANETEQKPPASLSEYAVSLPELFALKVPDNEYLIEPFLPLPSLAMVYARRGVGKTWFGLHLALCLANGVDFFTWPVTKPRRVLLVDGEMTVGYLNFRLKALVGEGKPPPNLHILPVAKMWSNNDSLTINKPADQSRIEQYLSEMEAANKRPDLIVFDNLSALMVGIDENDNSELDVFLRWLIKLRSLGYAVLFVHHAGKDGNQRGASRREDVLDTSIELVEQTSIDLNAADSACFKIRFPKLRGEHPNPLTLVVALAKDEAGKLNWHIGQDEKFPAYMKTLWQLDKLKPKTQAELAKHLGISKQAVGKQLQIAREKKLLDPDSLELTKKGKIDIDMAFADIDELCESM